MNPTLFHSLWLTHPGDKAACDAKLFQNQCAIRLGVALDAAKIHIVGVRRCAGVYPALRHHKPGHILSAQELADALAKHPAALGSKVRIHKMKGSITANMDYLKQKKGILFIVNGWGPTDHIDLWDGSSLRGGSELYFGKGEQIWFWQIA